MKRFSVCRFDANFGSQTVMFSFKCAGLQEVQPGQIKIMRKGSRMEVLVWRLLERVFFTKATRRAFSIPACTTPSEQLTFSTPSSHILLYKNAIFPVEAILRKILVDTHVDLISGLSSISESRQNKNRVRASGSLLTCDRANTHAWNIIYNIYKLKNKHKARSYVIYILLHTHTLSTQKHTRITLNVSSTLYSSMLWQFPYDTYLSRCITNRRNTWMGVENNQQLKYAFYMYCALCVNARNKYVIMTVTETVWWPKMWRALWPLLWNMHVLKIFQDTQLHCYTRELKKRFFYQNLKCINM